MVESPTMKAHWTKGLGPVESRPAKASRMYSPAACSQPPWRTVAGMRPIVVGTTTAAQSGTASTIATNRPTPERPSRMASTTATTATSTVAWAPPIQPPASTAAVVATMRRRARR